MIRIVIMVVACALGFGLYANPGHVGFTVRSVRVDDARLVTDEALAQITGDYIGRPMSRRTCQDLRERLGEHWAVTGVSVHRAWPDAMEVRLTERPVVARSSAPLAMIDCEGHVIEHVDVPAALPLLVGWDGDPIWLPVLALLERISAFSTLGEGSVVTGPPRDGFIELDCESLGIRMLVPCPADDQFDRRLSFTLTVLADARARGERPGVIDLRWANQILVTEVEG